MLCEERDTPGAAQVPRIGHLLTPAVIRDHLTVDLRLVQHGEHERFHTVVERFHFRQGDLLVAGLSRADRLDLTVEASGCLLLFLQWTQEHQIQMFRDGHLRREPERHWYCRQPSPP